MLTIDIDAQLDRIVEIQGLLRHTLLSEEPAGLEELLAEKRSRLDGVLALRPHGALDSAEVQVRLLQILNTDLDLQGLITRQLKVLSVAIRKAGDTRRAAAGYGGGARVDIAAAGVVI